MKKIFFYLLIFLVFSSCGGPEVYFNEPATGHRAFGLEGVYVFTRSNNDSAGTTSTDTLKFERIRKSEFLVTDYMRGDTVYSGEILKRRGLYLMNWPSSRQKGMWHISAFRFVGDSIYNYWGVYGITSFGPEISQMFAEVKETDTALYVNNEASETYKALEFAVTQGDRAGVVELKRSETGSKAELMPIANASSEFLVYPNPVKTDLILETKADGKYFAEIMDMNGKKIISAKYSDNYFQLDVRSLPAGNYVTRITDLSNNEINNFKIVVQK